MSCTVLAVPYALAWVVGAVVTATASALAEHEVSADSQININNMNNTGSINCEDVHVITDKHFMEKDFETPFVDKNILIKTLEEHGVRDISENDNQIFGRVESYSLTFTKYQADQPYTLKISCYENDKPENKLDDLNSEYAMNVQEDAYLHIMEKLKENNMEVEEEVVEDDNTIVLTVNID